MTPSSTRTPTEYSMSDPTDAPAGDHPHSEDDWDFDAEWEQARAATRAEQRSPPHAEISPYSMLYTGFLLGPPASLLALIMLLGRQLRLRSLLFGLGVCGTGWSILQAASFSLYPDWSPTAIQGLRTGINFCVGLVLLGFCLRNRSVLVVHDRQTLLNSVVFLLLLFLARASLSAEALWWLGR